MDSALFERLLYEEESTTLDFKKEQYRFVKASEDEKTELLKDILGFSNAWRRSDAYILIGVEEVRGGRANVIGIPAPDQLDDHSLQQFVNNLTNRPIRFHYEAFTYEGKQVGIIRIEQQPKPLFLKRDYGPLKKNEVYVRRGSSTDPTKPAGPDEIAQMGQSSAPEAAQLLVEFAEIERDDSLGNKVAWDAEYCEMPSMTSIPDLATQRQRITGLAIDLSAIHFDPLHRINDDYFRELANYEFATRLLRPIRVVVKNVGQIAANSVRIELTVPADIGAILIDPSDFPDPPKRHRNFPADSVMKGIRPAFRRDPGEVEIDRNDDRFRVAIDCGDLQPGRRAWSDTFYVGKRESGELALNGQVFADNLPQPKDFALTIAVNVTQRSMSVAELCALPEPTESNQ
ncbi:MAG: ATP-binding protein [Planctomycetia bacterium]|nr:ATP-binding protein [Planctomycetia bacterium]